MSGQLVLCGLVESTRIVAAGSTQRPCCFCDRPVWLSPSTVEAERAAGSEPWRPVCGPCLPNAGLPPEATAGLVPGAEEELVATLAAAITGRKEGSS